jgi:hypothetical protein
MNQFGSVANGAEKFLKFDCCFSNGAMNELRYWQRQRMLHDVSKSPMMPVAMIRPVSANIPRFPYPFA